MVKSTREVQPLTTEQKLDLILENQGAILANQKIVIENQEDILERVNNLSLDDPYGDNY